MNEEKWLHRGRVPSLDGLRALAICFVMTTHASRTIGTRDVLKYRLFSQLGLSGLEIFFVISGFLITLLMFRELERNGGLNIRAFLLRRILRTVPAYTCLLIAVAVLQYFGLSQMRRIDWIGALTYSINFVPDRAWDVGHCWSLSIEEHFYLIWPVMFAAVAPRWRAQCAIGGIVLGPGSRLILLLTSQKLANMADNWTFCRTDGIATGCLLAIWAWEGRPVLRRLASLKWTAPVAVVVLAGSLVLAARSNGYDFVISHTVNAACIALLVWMSACKGYKLLNAAPVLSVGGMAYSLYLWQQLFLTPERHNWTSKLPQNIALAFLAGTVSYFLIELPFQRIKNRIADKPNHAIANSDPQSADVSPVMPTAG